ncbi:HAMP domain-containing histidine kinase [Aurantibacter crassamenti]|uniref:sensor histidine kinase n=1 Tax=Aurantibacter crassamenti TaxID=1837375 RepID=UPI00193A95C4|nr:HAMP domain-containing sensor histidine kinase [Aurantibacter crassamenti]MBM1107639.1 HAMP domain-containing histidine kinase [Aurantibacter crassamenti]
MTTAEAKLKERIKELTCLYDVTSIIVNSDYDELETSLEAIAYCLKKAWQFENDSEVFFTCGNYTVRTKKYNAKMVELSSNIKVFNKIDGHIKVGYPADKYSISDFLIEEQTLLDNVSLAVGNLLERKQIRDSEASVKRQMERTDRLYILGEITAGIAHELNTPLANILGFAELLADKMTDNQAIRDLEKIIDNTIFSREIVKKLMFFACEMPQEMKIVELNAVVENVLKLLQPSLQEKKIKLIKSFNKENIKLKADTVQLTQVLFNLIMNAVYYSPENGQIAVQVTEKSKKIQILISDEGLGIPKKNEDKVFEPFFTTKPLGEGSGLGLSVVHGIINSHKGVIMHKSNNPKGTIFTVDFPKL